MRTLILGGGGMLGRALEGEARSRRYPVLAPARSEADITSPSAVMAKVESWRPELLVNCAAFTAVDACEERRDEAFATNGEALVNVVTAARAHGSRLVHVSTDYVFDGKASKPYTESAPTAPASVYGQSKLRGEEVVLGYEGALVVRSSWLFGPHGSNFVATMLRLAGEGRREVSVVQDQVGCPTYTPFLARALLDLAELGQTGLVHYRNRDPVSWHGFGQAIFRHRGAEVDVVPVTTQEFIDSVSRLVAPRPAYSVLAVDRFEAAVGRPVEKWQDALEDYLGPT